MASCRSRAATILTCGSLAENTDLSPKQARELIRTHGHNRDKLLEIARTMKAES
ncbi:hypothetical protein ACVOMV_33140 [Mesorhizobium atlanticum]